jgi:hypothetical protein
VLFRASACACWCNEHRNTAQSRHRATAGVSVAISGTTAARLLQPGSVKLLSLACLLPLPAQIAQRGGSCSELLISSSCCASSSRCTSTCVGSAAAPSTGRLVVCSQTGQVTTAADWRPGDVAAGCGGCAICWTQRRQHVCRHGSSFGSCICLWHTAQDSGSADVSVVWPSGTWLLLSPRGAAASSAGGWVCGGLASGAGAVPAAASVGCCASSASGGLCAPDTALCGSSLSPTCSPRLTRWAISSVICACIVAAVATCCFMACAALAP